FVELAQRMRNPVGLIFVKIIPYILMSIGILILYWGFGKWYEMPLHADFWWFVLCTFVFMLAVCFIGVLVSIVLPSQLKAAWMLMVFATVSWSFSGFTWPYSLMLCWVRLIADVMPSSRCLRIF